MKELTRAEEEVMQELWKLEKASVKEVLDQWNDPKPAYNTVSTIIRILEQKGFVDHEAIGRNYLYFPTVTKEEYSEGMMQKMKKNYFGNSIKNMVHFFLEKDDLNMNDLDEIINEIKKNKS